MPERFRDAMGARGFTPAEGVEGGWTRSPEADSNPEHVALRDGWLVRTFAGPDLFAKILDTWNGKCANARSLAHARTLVAGLPPSKPAVLRFGIEDQPLPDSPLRVIAMVMAPDAATGEEVVVVAFNAASGPETMLASDSWKKLMGRLTTPPRADRKEECLRIATRPEADPGFVEGRRKEVEARLLGLRSALDAYKIDQGRYPDSLARLTEIEFPSFTDDLWDPWGHAWIYELRENSFVVRSAGPDCRDGTADDIALPADR